VKLISHRGNIFGKEPDRENRVDYILETLAKGYDVEIDVRYIEKKWHIGHDSPIEEIDISFLEKGGLWVHCKNIEAFSQLYGNPSVNYFWHQKDDVVFTSFGYMWAYPGKQPILNSVAVLPEIYGDDTSACWGICSDVIGEYTK